VVTGGSIGAMVMLEPTVLEVGLFLLATTVLFLLLGCGRLSARSFCCVYLNLDVSLFMVFESDHGLDGPLGGMAALRIRMVLGFVGFTPLS